MPKEDANPVERFVRSFNYPPMEIIKRIDDLPRLGIKTFFFSNACLMTKKEVFKEVDGFDENYRHAFSDVDFCLKIRERGYLIVYTPYAELYHHVSLGRDHEDAPEKQVEFKKEIEYFQRKWHDVLAQGDPYYNPNLTLDREDFSIRI